MFEVVLSREAERVYVRADTALAHKLARCLARLEADPRAGNNVKKLSGPLTGLFRYRMGDHRVVYEINENAQCVTVIAIAHRRDVYE